MLSVQNQSYSVYMFMQSSAITYAGRHYTSSCLQLASTSWPLPYIGDMHPEIYVWVMCIYNPHSLANQINYK